MTLPPITADEFPKFFNELWGYDPFPWQVAFAQALARGITPAYVAVPTGSGKTACLDAAVFALALQAALPPEKRTQGRRIFFIVNRRVIVDEAFTRAGQLCDKLRAPTPGSVVEKTAAALRHLAGTMSDAPLTATQLRGGMYRERAWAQSLLQPMIVCSTVDQVGSRLLFRGYGVTPGARPLHAALIAQDSLLLIDEAHISRPFVQTLEWVSRYRRHQRPGGSTVALPFAVTQLTATPPAGIPAEQMIALSAADREHSLLGRRLNCAKPARLVVESKAKGKGRDEALVRRLVEEAESILKGAPNSSLAVMVNRVATAVEVAERLQTTHSGHVRLIIGRLRPLDREEVTRELQDRLKTGASSSIEHETPLIVVSTQCLEVGADFDFDALLTEAASLDALRQRFGRLNRDGTKPMTQSTIVLPADQEIPEEKLSEESPADLIYGNSVPRTWRWLNQQAQEGVIDFGLNAMAVMLKPLLEDGESLAKLLTPTGDAPIMLPAYLDCWVQTSQPPAADPNVALFLHGPRRELAEVQICWRADLPENSELDEWVETLDLCPPTTAECLPVRFSAFRKWLTSSGNFVDRSADVAEDLPTDQRREESLKTVKALLWRGPDESRFLQHPSELRGGETIILRAQDLAWSELLKFPDVTALPTLAEGKGLTKEAIGQLDLAKTAAAVVRRRAVLRVHELLFPGVTGATALGKLVDLAKEPDRDRSPEVIHGLLQEVANEEASGDQKPLPQFAALSFLIGLGAKELEIEPYLGDKGFVVRARRLMSRTEVAEVVGKSRGLAAPGDGASGSAEASAAEGLPNETDAEDLLAAAEPQLLEAHVQEVRECVEEYLAGMPLDHFVEPLRVATDLHDLGKADVRFQALLRGAAPYAIFAGGPLWAKSASIPASAAARRKARERATLPSGFRHEMLSVQLAQLTSGRLPKDPAALALTLHLIASHHGYARPFAPVVVDEQPCTVTMESGKETLRLSAQERMEHPPHALHAGYAERFWEVTRQYGWWGGALLEAVLRLADQNASASRQVPTKL